MRSSKHPRRTGLQHSTVVYFKFSYSNRVLSFVNNLSTCLNFKQNQVVIIVIIAVIAVVATQRSRNGLSFAVALFCF